MFLPPAGNILVQMEPRVGGGMSWSNWLRASLLRLPPKLILLDTGMIAELSKQDQTNLVSFFKALTKQVGQTSKGMHMNCCW